MDVDRLRELLDLVQATLEDPDTSADELAGRAHLSRFHFDRLISAGLGEPPGAFRRRLLLERAAHSLAHGDDQVIEIAFAAGYGGPEAFTRAFARAFGLAPSAYRAAGRDVHRLPCANGVHFTPPGGIRLPPDERSETMDVTTTMLDHHLWLSGEILDRAARLDDAALDEPIDISVEGIDASPTLRTVSAKLVSQLERWVAAFAGATAAPHAADDSPAALRRRLADAGPRFRDEIVTALSQGRAQETFVDATCEPAHVFTYAGVLAHVLTFSAVRRTLAIGALESAGIDDLGAGDPMPFVGGYGEDASRITRR